MTVPLQVTALIFIRTLTLYDRPRKRLWCLYRCTYTIDLHRIFVILKMAKPNRASLHNRCIASLFCCYNGGVNLTFYGNEFDCNRATSDLVRSNALIL